MSECPCPHHPTNCYSHPHSCGCAQSTVADAREIIAQEFRRVHRDTCYPDASTGECEIAALAIVAALNATGVRLAGPDDRILSPDEVADVRRIVEIANRNEWSAEGDRLARALGRKE